MRRNNILPRSVILFCLGTMILFNLSFANAKNCQTRDFNIKGNWQGSLKVSGMEIRIIFHVAEKADSTLSATMDSPDQGATGLPISAVIFRNDSLIIKADSFAGKYEGKIDKDKEVIVGKWKQGVYSLDLELKRTNEMPILKRPQTPSKPYPYDEEEVEYTNEKAGIKLAGTLTIPKSGGPFPAVILITGSGAQNRNEEVFGHKPFWIIADHFSRNGIAVLRVDDRGVGGSTGNVSLSTSEDFADDVLAGINFLKNHEKINSGLIGLVGHSEGGIVAPLVAAQSSDVVFIVLMAGTGLTGEKILYLQAALISRAMGVNEEIITQNRIQQEKIFNVIKEEIDEQTAKKKVREIMESAIPDSLDKNDAQIRSGIDMELKKMFNPWFRYFLTYDPRSALRKVKCPILAIIGEKDLQVPPKENLKAIEQALKDGGNADFTIKELPKLNHLFQTATTGSVAEYSKIEETISVVALDEMTNWILKKIRGEN